MSTTINVHTNSDQPDNNQDRLYFHSTLDVWPRTIKLGYTRYGSNTAGDHETTVFIDNQPAAALRMLAKDLKRAAKKLNARAEKLEANG